MHLNYFITLAFAVLQRLASAVSPDCPSPIPSAQIALAAFKDLNNFAEYMKSKVDSINLEDGIEADFAEGNLVELLGAMQVFAGEATAYSYVFNQLPTIPAAQDSLDAENVFDTFNLVDQDLIGLFKALASKGGYVEDERIRGDVVTVLGTLSGPFYSLGDALSAVVIPDYADDVRGWLAELGAAESTARDAYS